MREPVAHSLLGEVQLPGRSCGRPTNGSHGVVMFLGAWGALSMRGRGLVSARGGGAHSIVKRQCGALKIRVPGCPSEFLGLHRDSRSRANASISRCLRCVHRLSSLKPYGPWSVRSAPTSRERTTWSATPRPSPPPAGSQTCLHHRGPGLTRASGHERSVRAKVTTH